MESGQLCFESKDIQLIGGMSLEGLSKVDFRIRVPKEANQCVGSNDPYEIPKCAWVMKLV